jgi:chromosomal replication initiation ATPase DnaA
MTATPHVAIDQPDDALLGDLIVKLLGDRGVAAPPELAEYLVPRIERSYLTVQRIVDILDREMLLQHRRMTVPMARRALTEAGLIKRARYRD